MTRRHILLFAVALQIVLWALIVTALWGTV